MTVYANVGHILLKRGNTIQSTAYTGPAGEVTYDTGLRTLRVHDGSTVGGNVILVNQTTLTAYQTYANAATQATGINTINANIGSFQTYANANAATQATGINAITANIGGSQTYANTQVNTISANLGAYQTYANLTFSTVANAASQASDITTLYSNAATQATSIDTINANITAANTAIQSLSANIGALVTNAPGALDTLAEIDAALGNNASFSSVMVTWLGNITTNVTTANTSINTINANLGAYQIYANANIGTLYLGNISTQANLGAYQTYANANAASQTTSIATLQTQVYANANVATYLPTYTGNIAGNIVKSGYTWTFSNTGTTTFPTGVRLSNARGANTVNFTTDIDKSFQIETQTSTTSRLWSFGTDGSLTLPGNLVITGNANVFGTDAALIQSTDDLRLLTLSSGANGAVSSVWVEDIGNVGTSNIAAVYANPTVGSKIVRIVVGQNGVGSGPNLWDFGTNGTTTFPGSQILAPAGESITMQSDQYSQLMWENANVTVAPNMAINSNFYVAQNNATLDIGYRDGSSTQLIKTWLWSVDGGMSFPDTTTQYTAFSNAAVATYLSNYDGGINFTASPAVITGLGNISSANFTFANGVNILSTVGAGAYGNTQVASYLLNFDGDIEFTSSTAKIGNVDVITVMDSIRSPAYRFSNGVSILSGVVSKTTGSWTVTTGTNTYSFTVSTSGTYQLWVDCNIPNGILAWNATATITNSNVPVVGAQYAWVYDGSGTPIDFTSIPNQFVGTANTIVRSNTAPSATTNRFDFGINNTSGGNVTVSYGWIQIS